MNARDPRPITWRRVLVDVVGLAALALARRHHAPSDVHVAFWGLFFSIITGIWDVISSAAEFAYDALLAAMGWLKQKIFLLANVFGQGFNFIADVVKKVGEIFVGLWNDVLKPFFSQLYKWFVDLSNLLKKWLKPVVDFLLKVRDAVVKFYDTFVAPVLKALNIINAGLQILSDLGVKWASLLEAKIRQIEDAIRQPFLDILDKLNEAIGIINKIVTFDGLLQRVTLFKSLLTYRRDYTNFTINSIVMPMSSQGEADASAPYGSYSPEEHAAGVVSAWSNGWQPQTEFQNEIAGDLVLRYQSAGMVRG